jgi:hypothetical protein
VFGLLLLLFGLLLLLLGWVLQNPILSYRQGKNLMKRITLQEVNALAASLLDFVTEFVDPSITRLSGKPFPSSVFVACPDSLPLTKQQVSSAIHDALKHSKPPKFSAIPEELVPKETIDQLAACAALEPIDQSELDFAVPLRPPPVACVVPSASPPPPASTTTDPSVNASSTDASSILTAIVPTDVAPATATSSAIDNELPPAVASVSEIAPAKDMPPLGHAHLHPQAQAPTPYNHAHESISHRHQPRVMKAKQQMQAIAEYELSNSQSANRKIVTKTPPPATATRAVDKLTGTVTSMLSNGMRVSYKHTDFESKQCTIMLTGLGGMWLSRVSLRVQFRGTRIKY